MTGRVEGKVAIVIGGGQTPGQTVGNGRATAIVLAREGARVVVVDRDVASAEETVRLIRDKRGHAEALQADAADEAAVRRIFDTVIERHGQLDLLHNNVGASIALGDAPADTLTEEAFDRSFAVNLKSAWLATKHALPIFRKRGRGSIVNISSIAAANAQYGIRVNAILPGLMNTPMAIEARVAQGRSREEVIAMRDSKIPLGRKMGTGWDVAHAALFLHSDEAAFITGAVLVVDGGELVAHGL